MSTPQCLCHQCPCPHSEPWLTLPLPSQETFQDQQVSLAQAPMKSVFFSLSPSVHETLCTPSKRGVSVSVSVGEFLQSNPTYLQSEMLWELLFLMPDPQTGEPDVGLRTLIPVGEPL